MAGKKWVNPVARAVSKETEAHEPSAATEESTTTTGHDDTSLIAACRSGDPVAFRSLVERYQHRVYAVAYRCVGNHQDAEEVALDVFARAYRNLDGFEGRSSVYTWLYRIAVNLSSNRVRDRGRKGRDKGLSLEAEYSGAGPAATDARPDAFAANKELEAGLQAALDELPETCRTAFVLRTFEHLSYDAIAEAMECPKGTVKSRLNQARRLLRDILSERGLL